MHAPLQACSVADTLRSDVAGPAPALQSASPELKLPLSRPGSPLPVPARPHPSSLLSRVTCTSACRTYYAKFNRDTPSCRTGLPGIASIGTADVQDLTGRTPVISSTSQNFRRECDCDTPARAERPRTVLTCYAGAITGQTKAPTTPRRDAHSTTRDSARLPAFPEEIARQSGRPVWFASVGGFRCFGGVPRRAVNAMATAGSGRPLARRAVRLPGAATARHAHACMWGSLGGGG